MRGTRSSDSTLDRDKRVYTMPRIKTTDGAAWQIATLDSVVQFGADYHGH